YFEQAMHLWELVRQAVPTDHEAQNKVKQLGASETIARGNYGEAVKEAVSNEEPAVEPTGTPPPRTRKAATVKATRAAGKGEKPRAAGAADSSGRPPPSRRNGRLDEAKSILERGLAAVGQVPPLVLALEDLQIEALRRERARVEAKARAHPGDDASRALEKLD